MYGARAAVAGGMVHIEEQVEAIERAIVGNPSLTFDLARTIVESTCRTILTERKIAFRSDDNLPHLFKAVTTNLPMLPAEASGEVGARRSLAQTLGGLHTALQGVCELRNAHGFASHGVDNPRPVMESVQALLAAQAADAIVGFLDRLHHQERQAISMPEREYDDYQDFNAYIDDANEQVRIFDLIYRPSEVLFAVDQDAYRDLLADYRVRQCRCRSWAGEGAVSAGEFSESVIEQACLAWLEALGYAVLHGPDDRAGRTRRPSGAIRTTATLCWNVACGRRSFDSIPTCRPKRWKTPTAS